MNPEREQALIRAAQKGNRQAFADIYRENVDKIYRYILHRVETSSVAEDLTSDVFMRALEGLPTYKIQDTPFIAWLYTIANGKVVDHYRRRQHTPITEELDAVVETSDAELDASIIESQDQAVLRSAILALSPEQQQVIIFRFIEGYSLEKTALIMDKTEGAIKAMQHRALASMSRILNQSNIRSKLP